MNARSAALHALIAWQQKGTFLWDFLESWKNRESPDKRELDFAYELACQTARYLGYLEHVAKKLTTALPKKQSERLLLYLGLYQRIFLKNIPLYAVVSTTVELAKNLTFSHFARFLNAVLRKEIPEDSPDCITLHSYPEFFKNCLLNQYGKEKMLELLTVMNHPSICMATTYTDGKIDNRCYETPPESSYIQNCTPVQLVTTLAKTIQKTPTHILDLCAAPGGKTLLLAHLFPEAHLIAHDLPHKEKRLLENVHRFAPNVKVVTNHEAFADRKFDLILVDAPCSNSGVLYKCPEARWRLSQESLDQLEQVQIELIKQAITHLQKGGTLWYMTCSILQQENEAFVEKLQKTLGLTLNQFLLCLPDQKGQEGGFAASFSIN